MSNDNTNLTNLNKYPAGDEPNPYVAAQNPEYRFDKICEQASLPPRCKTVNQIGEYIAQRVPFKNKVIYKNSAYDKKESSP